MILLPVRNDFFYEKNGINIQAKDLMRENKYGVIVQVATPYFIYGYHCNMIGNPDGIIKHIVFDAARRVAEYDTILERLLLDSL